MSTAGPASSKESLAGNKKEKHLIEFILQG